MLSMSLCAGCSQLAYYGQAASGQWEVLRKRQPLDHVIHNPGSDVALIKKLQLVKALKTFASTQLYLPADASYQHYADLERSSAVWSVFATPQYSLTAKQWCFLIVGCLNYRGYFVEQQAIDFSQQLIAQGYDVYVANVPAYSTLGWFADPVFNTMLVWSDRHLIETILHELAHQKFYIKDDTAFNEAFAVAVAQLGTEQWLQHQPVKLQAYKQQLVYQQQFNQLLSTTHEQLQQLYQKPWAKHKLAINKALILQQMRQQYQQLKQNWNGYTGYDNWFAQDLNNAHFIAVSTYYELVPFFRAIFAQSGQDWPIFYNTLKSWQHLSMQQRHAKLRESHYVGLR